jgi:hypothetical protein
MYGMDAVCVCESRWVLGSRWDRASGLGFSMVSVYLLESSWESQST